MLQVYVQRFAVDDPIKQRNRTIVALLLGTGITSAEIRTARNEHLVIDSVRPSVKHASLHADRELDHIASHQDGARHRARQTFHAEPRLLD